MKVPELGWVDDIITVTKSGYKTARMNSFINAQIAMNKLRLGAKKMLCYAHRKQARGLQEY